MCDPIQILQDYFGYSSFRPGQKELVGGLLAGRDVLGILPTGAGKSICYQVPALAQDGVTLVISPLISLMKDQVASLIQSGVKAAYLNSSLTPGQLRLAQDRAAQGWYKIIYVAPERLLTEGFARVTRSIPISLVAVDEAHCVSQWGQDFRPGYLKIRDFLESLPVRPPVGAFTATATSTVRRDIISLLGLRDPVVTCTGFDRPNLFFEVLKPRDKKMALLSLLRREDPKSVIVYCATRKTVEEVCEMLNHAGFHAVQYHAGLTLEERRANQDDFLYDRIPVMVATNAFGMGIDKSDVSMVVHYNMPKNMESYYQEAGRAGRDGSPAKCVLLYSGQDVITNRFLIEHGADENEALSEEDRRRVRGLEEERLKKMTFYCFAKGCLRAYILKYFGQPAMHRCENCGNCLGTGQSEQEPVAHRPQAVPHKKQEELVERPELYEELRALRKRLAARAGVPAYVVFTDRALREMAGLLPTTEQELLEVSGVGRAKCERYGFDFLQVLRKYAEEHGKN